MLKNAEQLRKNYTDLFLPNIIFILIFYNSLEAFGLKASQI
jgi:hypothetical protein